MERLGTRWLGPKNHPAIKAVLMIEGSRKAPCGPNHPHCCCSFLLLLAGALRRVRTWEEMVRRAEGMMDWMGRYSSSLYPLRRVWRIFQQQR